MLNNDIKRMKEIMTHLRETKKKLRTQPLDASLRARITRVKDKALEELETLIERLK